MNIHNKKDNKISNGVKKMPKGAKDVTVEWRREMGWTAGRLWNYLGEHGKVTIETLTGDYQKIVTPEMLKLLGPELDISWGVLMALGWLASEGKVIIEGQTGPDRWLDACLTEVEQAIYRKEQESKKPEK